MKIALFRESGGLGDVICTGGAVRRLKAEEHEVWFVGMHEYEIAVNHLGYDNAYWLDYSVRLLRRDRNDLLRTGREYVECLKWLEFDRVYDLFCPGWQHEKVVAEYNEEQEINRVEAFQKACGLQDGFVRQIWEVTNEERLMAESWFKVKGIADPKSCMILHVESTDPVRSYPDHNVKELCSLLRRSNITPIIMDSEMRASRFGASGIVCWQEPLQLKAAVMQEVSRIICIDSGFLHLAGALGMKIYSLWGSTDGEQTTKLYEKNKSIYASDYFVEKNSRNLAMCSKCGRTTEINKMEDLKYCRHCGSEKSLKRADGKPQFSENYEVTCIPPCRIVPPFCKGRVCKWLDRINPYRIMEAIVGERP